MYRRRFLAASATLTTVAVAPRAVACRLFPAGVADRYVAWQDGKAIGHQTFSFHREPGRFVVEAELDMRFTAPGGAQVGYRHGSREIWDTGWLQALDSHTVIAGRRLEVHARRESGTLMVEGSDVRSYRLSTYIVPSNLWHRDCRLVDSLIDVESGNILLVRPRFAGRESLRQSGEVVAANHYTISGGIVREAWYDADCALVRWDLPLGSGDWISFRHERA